MKTEQFIVNSNGKGINEALSATETLGTEAGLDKKSFLQLRLLAEELFGLLKGIAGKVEATYQAESEGKNFEIRMRSEVNITDKMREQFLQASTSGKNSASTGFMGKIKVLIADIMLSYKQNLPYAMINTVSSMPMGGTAGEIASIWTLSDYRREVQVNVSKSVEADEAWDELEKSIIANIADDIKVRIVGANVEIDIIKTF